MKAILLARVSTEEQKEAGNSLPAQVFRLEKYIERNDKLTLEKEFTFDESAYKEDRAKFDDVIEFIEGQKEIVALCCDKVDRLARDFLVGLPKIEKLRREGKIELHFPGDNLVLHKDSPATDLFHFNIAVSLSQYYSNAISDNVKRALEQKLRSGEWTGQPHIGYINTLENEKKGFALDPERAYLVRKIFELYATGNYSVKTLRDEITKLGLRSRITRDEYDKKLKEYKEKQHDVTLRLEELTNADENYHITTATLFSLANRALEIFESSEVNEKRQLLNFLLQNCRLSGKNLAFELRSPFGMMLEYAHHPSVLRALEEVRTAMTITMP